jgi:hypothetical protein
MCASEHIVTVRMVKWKVQNFGASLNVLCREEQNHASKDTVCPATSPSQDSGTATSERVCWNPVTVIRCQSANKCKLLKVRVCWWDILYDGVASRSLLLAMQGLLVAQLLLSLLVENELVLWLGSGWTSGNSEFDSRLGQKYFSLHRVTLGHTQPPVQLETGAKQPSCESDLLLVSRLTMDGTTPTVIRKF